MNLTSGMWPTALFWALDDVGKACNPHDGLKSWATSKPILREGRLKTPPPKTISLGNSTVNPEMELIMDLSQGDCWPPGRLNSNNPNRSLEWSLLNRVSHLVIDGAVCLKAAGDSWMTIAKVHPSPRVSAYATPETQRVIFLKGLSTLFQTQSGLWQERNHYYSLTWHLEAAIKSRATEDLLARSWDRYQGAGT